MISGVSITQYFKAMRIPFLRGRNFTEQEVRESAKVVIISDLLAQQGFSRRGANRQAADHW